MNTNTLTRKLPPGGWMRSKVSEIVLHWLDLSVISFPLLSNSVVGCWEERQAGNVIAALKVKLARKAKVKRDGKWVAPAARELRPGDARRTRRSGVEPRTYHSELTALLVWH